MQTAKVDVDESFAVNAPPTRVWALLVEPEVVVTCMPGAEVVTTNPDGTIDGRMRVKLGPTVVDFAGTVTMAVDDVARRGEVTARGADRTGRTRAIATITFWVTDGVDEGRSQVNLHGNIGVTGGLSTFVRTGGAHLARRMLSDFADSFVEVCAHPAPQGGTAAGDAIATAGPCGPPHLDPHAAVLTAPPSPPSRTSAVTAPVSGLRLLGGAVRDLARQVWAQLLRAVRPGQGGSR